ncbi:alpha-ketoglutarate-dependent dioxygenase AlkB [Synechococcus sp. M16CYN]|uniref:alpha-ketoglutarate-dependent dioxygenase AlkB family protein n=1 Tax=Synechococcus sp. M16CYN TaxID=3103139 RepID=UPI00324ADE6F
MDSASILAPRPDWSLLPGWLSVNEARKWQQLLRYNICWQQPIVQVYGKYHIVPRQTVFLAQLGLRYRYSGLVHIGEGWPDWCIPLVEQVSYVCRTSFNGCLLNLYRHGNDHMGWHTDNETEIDQTQPIASLSLGSTRDFRLKYRADPTQQKSIPLANGDLLIMHPGCQQRWIHSVPQRRKVKTARINLTFRRYFQKR